MLYRCIRLYNHVRYSSRFFCFPKKKFESLSVYALSFNNAAQHTFYSDLTLNSESVTKTSNYIPNALEKIPPDEIQKVEPEGELEPVQQEESERGFYTINGIKFPVKSHSFLPYVDYSDTLTKLVKLGVDLSVVEKKPYIGKYLMNLNFDQDILPHLLFLKDLGIKDQDLGDILTKCPFILQESCESLQNKVDYFKEMKFTDEDIQIFLERCPSIFIMSVERIDAKLALYQSKFFLHDSVVRKTVVKTPKLITLHPDIIEDTLFQWDDVYGFSISERRKLLTCPKGTLMTRSREHFSAVFNYAYDVMGLSHRYMVTYPGVLLCRPSRLRQRHEYLMHLNKAQYDPKKPNYVSMDALVGGDTKSFCEDVAKTSEEHFIAFLKSL